MKNVSTIPSELTLTDYVDTLADYSVEVYSVASSSEGTRLGLPSGYQYSAIMIYRQNANYAVIVMYPYFSASSTSRKPIRKARVSADAWTGWYDFMGNAVT